MDWEVELAAVIASTSRHVPVADGLRHVLGYTVANDVCARDVQFGDGQWVRGKSLDVFCPLGPVVVTSEEIDDPQSLGLRTRVNGETVQEGATAETLFDVAALVSYLSVNFTPEAGAVLLTGTPWGGGEFMDLRRHLHTDDEVEVEVDGIGTLRNPDTSA